MHPVQEHLFDTNFKDLAGTKIEGTIALSEELINLGVMDFLNSLKAAPEASDQPAAPAPPAVPTAAPDPKALLQVLNVEQLQVRMEAGRLLVDIKAGV